MAFQILLTDKEQALRRLFLDVSDYIGTHSDCAKPVVRFTGGWVRDKLLGHESSDIDVAISSMSGYAFGAHVNQYIQIPKIQSAYGLDSVRGLSRISANPEKSKHLETATTKIFGLDVDLVNLRKEQYTGNSRNPKAELGTPEDDALRRDSTVNALFFNLSTSTVEDFTGRGLYDLRHQVIRTPVQSYQTFIDDPLRVLRCIRFASKLGYTIDSEAELAMASTVIRDALREKISRERIGVEIGKMLRGDPITADCQSSRLIKSVRTRSTGDTCVN